MSGSGITKIHRRLCKVIEVGKYDIFAMHIIENDYNKPFRIPRRRCQKVDIRETDIHAKVSEPKVGDLVISISSYFGKIDQKIGRVKEIIDKPGTTKQVLLDYSTKEFTAPYDSLIILEE